MNRIISVLALVALVAVGFAVVMFSGGDGPSSTGSRVITPTPTSSLPTRTPGGALAIRGATLIDGTGKPAVQNATIVIEGSRIRQVGIGNELTLPPDTEIIDATGKFVIPGLADMHNHLRNGMTMDWDKMRRNLRLLLGQGITLVFDPAIDISAFTDLKQLTAPDAGVPHARFYGVGHIFHPTSPGGVDFSPQNPAQARDNVRTLKEAHVDAIKIYHDDSSWVTEKLPQVFSPTILKAITDEAHAQGLKVYVHAPMLKFAKEALQAGADGMLHSVISDPVDDEFIALMKKNQAVYIPTLSLFESCGDFDGWVKRQAAFDDWGANPQHRYQNLLQSEVRTKALTSWTNAAYAKAHQAQARANLKHVYEAGVPIVAGTDTGLLGVILGVSSHLELALNVEAGMPAAAVLQAATINAARMIGREQDLGSIEVGKLADLVILHGDPLADIRNTRRVYRVVRGGTTYDPQELMNVE